MRELSWSWSIPGNTVADLQIGEIDAVSMNRQAPLILMNSGPDVERGRSDITNLPSDPVGLALTDLLPGAGTNPAATVL